MELMPEFSVLRPCCVDEAVDLFRRHPRARYIAGGTDLMVNIRRGVAAPETLIDLAAIAGLRKIENDSAGGLSIGAGVTLAALLDHGAVAGEYRAVFEAAGMVAAPTHRNVATVGGNLCLDTRCVFYNQSEWWRAANDYCLKHKGDVCHVAPSGDHCFAAYSGDLAPALLAFDAKVDIAGPEGGRTVPLNNIYADDGAAHMLLKEGEIITAVRLPAGSGAVSGYVKARVRDSMDFPLAGVAIRLEMKAGRIGDIRLALTGLNSRPLLVEGTGTLEGRAVDDACVDDLCSLLPKRIQPMASTITPPGYRRKVAANLCRKLMFSLNDR